MDGTPITVDALKLEMNRNPYRYQNEALIRSLLDGMIADEVVYSKALREEYDKRPEVMAAYRQFIVDRYKRDNLIPKLEEISVGDDEIKAYFDEKASQFRTPEKVRAAIIKISIPSRASDNKRAELLVRAEECRKYALELKPEVRGFGSVAVKCSDHQTTRYRGGDAGFLTRDQAVAAWGNDVAEKIFSLAAPGEVSPIVENENSFHLIRLIEKKESQPRSLAEAREELRFKLAAKKKKKLEDEFYAKLKTEINVSINEAALASMRPVFRSMANNKEREPQATPPPLPK